jgi:hypothetical protein
MTINSTFSHNCRYSPICLDTERQAGVTIIELLVTVLLMSIVMLGVVGTVTWTSRQSIDHEIIARVNEQARAILDYMAYDMRMLGSGMPLGQTGFPIGGTGLGDAPLPLLTTSDDDQIELRLNERGSDTVLTANYTPSAANLTLSVLSASDFEAGDMLYVSDHTQGGTSGMQGTVAQVGNDWITLENTYVATAGATFKSGSTVSRVSTITYESPADGSGVTRDTGEGPVALEPNSTFNLDYLDATGTEITPPLTAAAIAANLYTIRVTVSVQASQPLYDGTTYSTEAVQEIGLRNLILSR